MDSLGNLDILFLQQFEAAVLICVQQADASASTISEVRGATSFIQSISSHPEAQILCLRLLMTSKRPEARFFCLQALADIALTPLHAFGVQPVILQQREQVRNQLLHYALQRCSLLEEDPPFVRGKLALCIARFVKVDYPERWNSAISDILSPFSRLGFSIQTSDGINVFGGEGGNSQLGTTSSLSRPALLYFDIVLRVLSCLQEEVAELGIVRGQDELVRNTKVKDALRLSGDAGKIVHLLYSVISTSVPALVAYDTAMSQQGSLQQIQQSTPSSFLAPNSSSSSNSNSNSFSIMSSSTTPSVVSSSSSSSSSPPTDSDLLLLSQLCTINTRSALSILAAYGKWIDIKLLANPSMSQLFFTLLGVSCVRLPVIKVLQALVEKGMDDVSKLELIRALSLVEITSRLTHFVESAFQVTVDVTSKISSYKRHGQDEDEDIVYSRTGFDDDSDFGACAAELVTSVIIALLSALDSPAVIHALKNEDEGGSIALRTFFTGSIRLLCDHVIRFLGLVHCDGSLGLEILPAISGIVSQIGKEMSSTTISTTSPSSPPSSSPPSSSIGISKIVPPLCSEFASSLTLTICKQFAYPKNFSFDDEDDDETADFIEFRTGLKKLFAGLVRISPESVLSVLTSSHSGGPLSSDSINLWNNSSTRWQTIESSLFILQNFCEGLPHGTLGQVTTGKTIAPPTKLYLMISSLLELVFSSISFQNGRVFHQCVTLQFFELASRFYHLLVERSAFTDLYSHMQVLQHQQQFASLPQILEAMLTTSGLRNPIPSVRARTAYLLLRFIKNLVKLGVQVQGQGVQGHVQGQGVQGQGVQGQVQGQMIILSFIPLTESLLLGIKEFLNVPYVPVTHSTLLLRDPSISSAEEDSEELEMTRGPSGLGSTDAQYIFEIVGTLLSQPWVESGKRITYTKIVIDPLLGSLEAGLAHLQAPENAAHRISASVDIARWIARVLSALGHITKGTGIIQVIQVRESPNAKEIEEEELACLLERAHFRSISALLTLPGNTAVRSKALFFFHRITDCLGVRLLCCAHAAVAPPETSPGNIIPLESCFRALLSSGVSDREDEVKDVIVFLQQVVVKFKRTSLHLVSSFLQHLVARVVHLSTSSSSSSSTSSTLNNSTAVSAYIPSFNSSRSDLHKSLAQLFLNLVSQGLADIFLQTSLYEGGMHRFPLIDVAVSIATGSYSGPVIDTSGLSTNIGVDPSVQKAILQFLSALIKTVLEGSTSVSVLAQREILKSFSIYATETLIRAALFCVMSPSIDERDAQCQQVIGETVHLLSTVLLYCPTLYFEGRNISTSDEKAQMLTLFRHIMVVEIKLSSQPCENFLNKLGTISVGTTGSAPRGGEAKALLVQLISSRKGRS